MRNINFIVVHCSATPQTATIASMWNYWRTEMKWKNPGYHYVITPSGTVERLHPVHLPANGVRGHNHHSIHVCYIGGVKSNMQPVDNRTPAQRNALFILLRSLHRTYPQARIVGHRDLSKDLNGNGIIEPREWVKQCPSFDVQPLAQEIYNYPGR